MRAEIDASNVLTWSAVKATGCEYSMGSDEKAILPTGSRRTTTSSALTMTLGGTCAVAQPAVKANRIESHKRGSAAPCCR